MLYSSMVPGNLPSQLEILSTGQNYYGTLLYIQVLQVAFFAALLLLQGLQHG